MRHGLWAPLQAPNRRRPGRARAQAHGHDPRISPRRYRARRAAQHHHLQHAEIRKVIELSNADGEVPSLLFQNAKIEEAVEFLITGPPR